MKKLFTLTMLLVLAMTANAQETYRKSWDFTKWSATTLANLKAESAKITITGDGTGYTDNGARWAEVEKASSNTTYSLSKDGKCYWEVTAQGNATTGTTLVANDAPIAETEGLLFTHTNAKNLAIAVDYGDCSSISGAGFGPYKGGSYLWLGGSGKNYFVIPHVAPGTSIKLGVESHKLTDARGVELYVGWGNSGTKLLDPNGNEVAKPTEYQDQEFVVPADAEATNEDGTVDVTVRNSNGCHIYYITVGDGDSPQTEEAKKVAYVGTEDFTTGMFDPGVVAATVVDAVPAISELQENYDALVVGTTATAEQLQAVKSIIAFFPVVNTNPALYAAIGEGSAAEAADPNLTITDTGNAIFEGLDEVIETAGISAITLGAYFADDQVLAKAGDAVAIHTHNPGRNAYYFIPVDENTEALYQLLSNTIIAASKTKRAVAAVGTPNISVAQADGVSTVTITATNSTAIYYTTDGTEPTAASTAYTEPFSLTADATVKAFATGDGYTDSQVASADVKIATQVAAPTFTISREAGKSTVTINAAEGAKVYFNYNGATTAALSQAYTEPIELTEPATIYALATADGSLPSDLAEQFVGIDGIDASNIRLDVIAHFNASEADWFINDASILPNQSGGANAYYFWGKSAWKYYSDEVDHTETVKDSEGNDSIVYIYKPDPNALKVVTPLTDTPWILKSEGQVLTGELQLAPGDGVGNGATGRYAEEAIDFLPAGLNNGVTKGVITFGSKTSGEPYTARIESTVKYTGPFDVVVYCGNGNNGSASEMEFQTSTDGENWTKLVTLNMAGTQRYIKRTKASYEGTDEVYVRIAQIATASKAQVYDIYLLNNGTESQAYTEEAAGISNLAAPAIGKAAVYSLGGTRQQGLKRGLNIVVENGVAKKILVK